MSKIQIDSGHSSSATHRLTQASTTLNRRYVRRPTNIIVEEAAKNAAHETNDPEVPALPSRLVNLRVSTADLEAARAKEEETRKMAKTIQKHTADSEPTTFTPRIIELGTDDVAEDDSAVVEADQQSSAPASSSVEAIEPEPNAPQEPQVSTIEAAAGPSIATIEPETTPIVDAKSPASDIDTQKLVMSIANDYAKASLSASIKEYSEEQAHDYALSQGDLGAMSENQAAEPVIETIETTETTEPVDSVDAIARAASEAIASIRVATEPSEVSEQVSSLKAFADNIKANQSMPEMRELGDTIDKFINVAMKSTKMQEATKKSATKVALSPKANRAATKVAKTSAKVMQANNRAKRVVTKPTLNHSMGAISRPALTSPTIRHTSSTRTMRQPTMSREDALQAAMHSVATMEAKDSKPAPRPMLKKHKGNTKRFAIAFACAAVCVLGVIGLVGSNMPDISIRVAAMQTGIEASYPSYIPRDYSLSDINSENGKITMQFKGPEDATFTLIEEKSSWDSSALLRNYVEPTWQENYTTTHEQGITIYISNVNSDAAWVNGGILYKITSSGTALTKKQVRSIVTSL